MQGKTMIVVANAGDLATWPLHGKIIALHAELHEDKHLYKHQRFPEFRIFQSRRPGTGPQNENSQKNLVQVLAKMGVLAEVLAQVPAGWALWGKQRQNSLPAPVPALRPAPPSLPAPVPAPAPAFFFLNSHFGVLCQVAGIGTPE